MWKIWCSHNKCIFKDIKHFVQEIGTQVLSFLHHVLNFFAYPTSHIVQKPSCIVSWQQFSMDSVALNVDASVFLESNLGGFGDLICDHTFFLLVFFGKISRHFILHFGILGLHHGLKLCWDIEFKMFCLSNSTIVVDLIQKNLNEHHKYRNLIIGY